MSGDQKSESLPKSINDNKMMAAVSRSDLSEADKFEAVLQILSSLKQDIDEIPEKEELENLVSNVDDDRLEKIKDLIGKYNAENKEFIYPIKITKRGHTWLNNYKEEFDVEEKRILSVVLSSVMKREKDMKKRLSVKLYLDDEISDEKLEEYIDDRKFEKIKEQKEVINEIN